LKLLNTSSILNFPEDVKVAYTEIKEGLSLEVLSDRERKEWESFTNEHRKNEFLSARHLFRDMMDELRMSLEYKLQKHPLGKPFASIGNQAINVSFSHSKSKVFCAISKKLDIGLDTEWLDRKVDERIVRRILGENEWKVFSEENPILLWTIKEAAVKCLGTGLRTNLKELEIQRKGNEEFLVRINDEKSFQICSFQKLNHQISIAY